VRMRGTVAVIILYCVGWIYSQDCCQKKTVSGSGSLSGVFTYHSISTVGTYPAECSDGCMYIKDGDTSITYCFKDTGPYSIASEACTGTTTASSSQGGGGGGGSQASYCALAADHTMCLYTGPAATCAAKTHERELTAAAKTAIVDKHNEVRRKVAKGEETNGNQPAASNMRMLKWNDELATTAQMWADQCTFGHDTARNKLDWTYVGQNAYFKGSSTKKDKSTLMTEVGNEATLAWYNEVVSPGFTNTHVNPFVFSADAGHYTQVVWAETEEVGCGWTYYAEQVGPFLAYKSLTICNYAKGGNAAGQAMYKSGTACSACDQGYSCQDSLCTK